MSVEEGTHTLADGKKLFTKTFRVVYSGACAIVIGINLLNRPTGPPRQDLFLSMAFQMYVVMVTLEITSTAVLTDDG